MSILSLCVTACTTLVPSETRSPAPSPSPSQSSAAPEPTASPSPVPTASPSSTTQANPSPHSPDQPLATSTGKPSQDLTVVKSIGIEIVGKQYLNGQNDSTQLNALLKGADGQILNPTDFPLEWLSSRPQDFSIDSTGKVIAQTDYGYSTITLRVKGTDLAFQQLLSVNAPFNAPSNRSSERRPAVASLSPIGSIAGNRVVITGKNFTNVSSVRFGKKAATFKVNSSTQITAKVPAGSGTANITVTNEGGTSPVIDASKFYYTISNFNYSWPEDQSQTRAPNIGFGTVTEFSAYSNGFTWNYSNFSFKVPVTGEYTITATTSPEVNTSWILKGLFEPSVTPTVDPVTPLSNFIIQNFSGGNTATLSNVSLEAGEQYTLLTAFNHGDFLGNMLDVSFEGPDGIGVIPTNPNP